MMALNLTSNVQVIISAFCFSLCLLKRISSEKWFKNIGHMFLIYFLFFYFAYFERERA